MIFTNYMRNFLTHEAAHTERAGLYLAALTTTKLTFFKGQNP